jgi:hypothetical protein
MTSKQLLFVGSVSIGGGSAIPLYADVSKVCDNRVTTTLSHKLGALMGTRFTPDEIEKPALLRPDGLIGIDEVLTQWGCHYVTVLRVMKRGLLHQIDFEGEICFDRDEVNRLRNRRIAVYPHLTSSNPRIKRGPIC